MIEARGVEKCGEGTPGSCSRGLCEDSTRLAPFWTPPGVDQSNQMFPVVHFVRILFGLSSFRVSEMAVNNKKKLFTL